eukprot:TRINITY_DN851_c0_g1_i9.p2 TRINITY_DN851_c0_g1~~TRINITY_DN851_c0_g1_i9.p2  ORF type:complete len:179 (+),score=15.94 TRINITY_DN851_c0_g1_i9:64-537(+)
MGDASALNGGQESDCSQPHHEEPPQLSGNALRRHVDNSDGSNQRNAEETKSTSDSTYRPCAQAGRVEDFEAYCLTGSSVDAEAGQPSSPASSPRPFEPPVRQDCQDDDDGSRDGAPSCRSSPTLLFLPPCRWAATPLSIFRLNCWPEGGRSCRSVSR